MDSLPQDLTVKTPISARLGRFAHEWRAEDIPADVVEQAKRHMLDCLGIALASSGFDFGMRIANAMSGLAGPGAHPVIGHAMRLPLRDAVMVNGSFIHGLDYDDTHSDSVVHASASAVPTALHMAREHGASGREALAAYILGIEGSARIGAAAQGGFHQVGFHPTGMVGAFGAALTAGRLAGATAAQIQAAQGIILSMAAGSLEFLEDGSWTKRIHPGWAGVAAITATALARGGFKAPPAAYEGRFGLFNSHMQDKAPSDLSRCAERLGELWEMRNVALKPYPCCHFNHAFADAALALRAAHGLTAADIARITCRIHEGQVKVVCEPEASKKAPANSYDAQFSVHYAVCCALIHGRFSLDEIYDEEMIRHPAVLDLMARTGYAVDNSLPFPRYYGGELVIELRDGRVLRHREEKNRGSDGNPLSMADVERKFLENAGRVLSRSRAQRVLDLAMTLDAAQDVAALTDALSG
ncbi:MAG: MmgE/PrpD family protein [Acetobacteraceae bacterium]|nr:MmgE/PrpD family protein [Acetobacteraceae bacterium]